MLNNSNPIFNIPLKYKYSNIILPTLQMEKQRLPKQQQNINSSTLKYDQMEFKTELESEFRHRLIVCPFNKYTESHFLPEKKENGNVQYTEKQGQFICNCEKIKYMFYNSYLLRKEMRPDK